MDRRPFEQRTLGGLLLDFYRIQAARLHELSTRKRRLDQDERMERRSLELLFEDVRAPTLFAQLDKRTTRKTTGDAKVDGWYDALDRGEVPDELFGPNGPTPEMRKLLEAAKKKLEARG